MATTHPAEHTIPTGADRLWGIELGAFSWAVIGYGVLSAALGLALLVWPKIPLVVAAALLAAQFVVTGIIQLVWCLGPWADGAGERAVLAVTGALALLTGLLILRKPLQSLVIVTVIVGAWWILRGALDIIGSLPGGTPHRGWNVLFGAISLVAGVYVLLNPGISLVAFVVVTGVWMIVWGITVAASAAITLRRSPRGEAVS